MIRVLATSAVLACGAAETARANAWSLVPSGTSFERVDDKATFVQIVADRALKRFGIQLEVNPDGTIAGKAFGRDVAGAWQWQDGFFCRELFWGNWEVGANCQAVEVSGDMMRFTSDRGRGDFADLRLR